MLKDCKFLLIGGKFRQFTVTRPSVFDTIISVSKLLLESRVHPKTGELYQWKDTLIEGASQINTNVLQPSESSYHSKLIKTFPLFTNGFCLLGE